MTVAEHLRQLRRCYRILRPSSESITFTEELWNAWETNTLKRPDILKTAQSVDEIEEGFFLELVRIAAQLAGHTFTAHYCPFLTSKYNLSAVTATDGYIVLIDEVFFQFLFILVTVLMYEAYDDIDSNYRERLRSELEEALRISYLNRYRYEVVTTSAYAQLLSRNYTTTEMGGFLFQSFKGFLIGHELGHHALQHPVIRLERHFLTNDARMTVHCDQPEWECEFAADAFGYCVLRDATRPDSTIAPLHHFNWVFPFAPVLLFDICKRLDEVSAQEKGRSAFDGVGVTHPPLDQRKAALVQAFAIDTNDSVYGYLREAVESYLPV
jgi:hypothetical protein